MNDYIKENIEKIYEFLIQILPHLLILFLIGIFLFKFTNILSKKIKNIAMKSTKKLDEIHKMEFEKRADTLVGIVKAILNISIWIILIMVFLKKIGIDIIPFLTGAGIIGVAIGFGSQELIRDMISGFFILMENQIRQGDVAIINGTGGLVEKIGLRTIILRDFSGTVHIFQNGKIDTLSNMTKDWSAVVFDIGVAYKEDIDKVIKVMEKTGKDLKEDVNFKERIIEDLEIFGIEKFETSSVIVRARFKTKPIEQWNVGREYRKRLKAEFEKNKIEIPFPHISLYWGEKINPLKINMEK